MKSLITPGIYRHFRGNRYRVYGTARHSENDEAMVVYRALYEARELWVRPLAMFSENVVVNGEEIPRFSLIATSDISLVDLLSHDG